MFSLVLRGCSLLMSGDSIPSVLRSSLALSANCIERELKKQNISLNTLAKGTDSPFQKIKAIIAGEYNPTTEEFSKIENILKLENGFLAVLQYYYDIGQAEDQRLASLYPIPPRIRKFLFWDVDFEKINWGKYKRTVIKRVLEKGSKEEIMEIKRYYNMLIK